MNTTMKYYIFLLLLFVGAQKNSFAQQQVIDSLEHVLRNTNEDTVRVNSLNALSKQNIDISDFVMAKQYADSALELAKKLNYKKGIANAHNNIGIVYKNQGNYPEALENYLASLKINEEIGDKKSIAHVYNNMGIVYQSMGNYPEGLKNSMASLKICEETGDKKGSAHAYSNIGVVYSSQGNYAEGLKNFYNSLKIMEEVGNKHGVAQAYNNIGLIYESQDNFPEALKNHFASLKIKEEIGDKSGMASSYNNIGIIYSVQEKYQEALENYFTSLKINEEVGNKLGIAGAYSNIGVAYFNQENFYEADKYFRAALKFSEEIGDDEAIASNYCSIGEVNVIFSNFPEARKNLEDGLALSKKIGNKWLIHLNYECLSRLDSAEGNFAQALEDYRMYTLYKDSLLNEESNYQTAQLKIQYETEKKDQEIALLNKDKELHVQQLEKQRLVRNVMIAGTILLLLVGLLLFHSFRLRKKLEKQQAIIQERKRISADLHDDVGSGLSKIMLLSELVKKVAKTPETRQEAEKISAISQELSSNISEIIWALNSNNDYVENLVAYIRRYAAEYFENGSVKLKITTPTKMDHIHISGAHRRNIFFAVKEALHNIIKHAGATEAELRFKLDHDVLSVVIKDNGKGFPLGELNRFGNGLNNMKNRMKSINGNLSIENHVGTKITLSLPV